MFIFILLFSDIQKLSYSALVLTMIFSMGEALPVQHYRESCFTYFPTKNPRHFVFRDSYYFCLFAEQINDKFVDFLLDNIENNDHEQIPDLFVNLILAFNLHYEMPSDNDVMKVLAKRGTAKTFTEKVMLLVNRGGMHSQLYICILV